MPAGQLCPPGQLFHLWYGTLLFLPLSSFQDLFFTVRIVVVCPTSFPYHVPEGCSPLPPPALPPCSTPRQSAQNYSLHPAAPTLPKRVLSKIPQPFPQGLTCTLESLKVLAAHEHTIFKQLGCPWWSSLDLLLNQSLHHPDVHQCCVFSASTGQRRVSY